MAGCRAVKEGGQDKGNKEKVLGIEVRTKVLVRSHGSQYVSTELRGGSQFLGKEPTGADMRGSSRPLEGGFRDRLH